MDDVMLVRFALDNVRVPEIAATAQEAFDRIIRGQAVVDRDRPDAFERTGRPRDEAAPTAAYRSHPPEAVACRCRVDLPSRA